jgi:transposase
MQGVLRLIAQNNIRVFLCTQDTDMRKSFGALTGTVSRAMHLDPLSGYLFVFKNKRADRIKVLYWDRDGLAIWYKVLQKGTFKFPNIQKMDSAGIEIDAATLRLILDGVDLGSIRRRPRYRLDDRSLDTHRGVPQPPGQNFDSLDGDGPEHHI